MRSATLDFLRQRGSCVLRAEEGQKAAENLHGFRYGGTEGVDATRAQLGKRFNRGPKGAKDSDAVSAPR